MDTGQLSAIREDPAKLARNAENTVIREQNVVTDQCPTREGDHIEMIVILAAMGKGITGGQDRIHPREEAADAILGANEGMKVANLMGGEAEETRGMTVASAEILHTRKRKKI